jgi:hypothetical protein
MVANKAEVTVGRVRRGIFIACRRYNDTVWLGIDSRRYAGSVGHPPPPETVGSDIYPDRYVAWHFRVKEGGEAKR